MSRAASSLHFAVRPRVVFKYLGLLFLPLAATACVPAVVSAATGNLAATWRYAAVIVVLAGAGWPLSRLRSTRKVQTNEAIVVTALIFILAPLAMSVPLGAYGLSPLDAVFEAVSGVTTTGLSTLASAEAMPRAFLFGRAWLQWVGGLGVVVLALALIIRPGIVTKRMGFHERELGDVAQTARTHARRVLGVYAVLSVAGVALIWVLGASFFDAIVHAMAAISTGGFSTHDASLAGIDSVWSRGAVMLVCFAGSISFSWYYLGLYRHPLRMLRDIQIRALLLVSLLVVLVLQIDLLAVGREPLEAAGHALVTGISAQSTAGFSSLATAELSDPSKLALIGSMVVGGSVGSTAGGIKILRFVILVRLVLLLLQDASIPRAGRLPLRVGSMRVQPDEIRSAAGLALAHGGVVFLSWLAFLAHGHPALDSLFEVASATGTVGLSAGITGAELEPALKALLCADMIIGRVEVVSALILLYPPTWFGKRKG